MFVTYNTRQKSRSELHRGIRWLRIIEKSVNVAVQPRRDSNDGIYGMRVRDSMATNQCSPRSTPLTIVNSVSLRYSIQYKTLHPKRLPIEVYSCLVIKVLQYELSGNQSTQYRPRCEFHGSIGPNGTTL